ncbi:MAG: hypothetical protein ACRDZ4_07275 [Egibacteraceae bacterium]
MDGFSVLNPPQQRGGDGQDSTLVDLVRAAVERDDADAWKVWLDDMWCHALPLGYRSRGQGWKLHVSATRASATAVLERSIAVLLRERCAFKFAKSFEHVGQLNSTHYPRGSAGKFLTAYPDDDEHFRLVAEELDRATDGLPGPTLLPDRPYRPDSLVHYRYGAFAGRTVLSNDGYYRFLLEGPDGALIEKRRDAWFTPLAWAHTPLDGEAAPAVAGGEARPVRPGDRFIVREAIRHAYRGGVYRATDTRTDAEVVVKPARAHVESYHKGWDVREALRHEAEILDLLAPLDIAPRKIALFEQDGHIFLAEELILGTSLSTCLRIAALPRGRSETERGFGGRLWGTPPTPGHRNRLR